jgi:hypothetical protein
MRLDNLLNDSQPEAGPLLVGQVARLEDSFTLGFGDAGAGDGLYNKSSLAKVQATTRRGYKRLSDTLE